MAHLTSSLGDLNQAPRDHDTIMASKKRKIIECVSGTSNCGWQ